LLARKQQIREGQNGYADPDNPPVIPEKSGGKGLEYTLPKASVTALRRTVQ
jgi:hypothetical protein